MSLPSSLPPSGDPRPARTLVFRGHQLLVDLAATPTAGPDSWRAGLVALRAIDFPVTTGEAWTVVEVERTIEAPDGHAFQHLKSLLDTLDGETLALAARALELLEFDRAHRFCGACGAPTTLRTDPPARRCSAPDCGREHFPRVSPVVIVAVERGAEILLGRSPHFPPGLYSTLAGFVDAGESAEQAVHREIFEETGLRIRAPRYFSSQAWPFPHALMLGYQAEYAGGDIVCAPGEIEDARFFHVDALPPLFPIRYAMEEAAIWKRRALEAEDLNRKFIAKINGPMHMGEPAHPAPSVPNTYAAGINAVAAMLQSKADEYAKEHGHDDMGGLSFGPGMGGEIKMDYYTNLVELVDDVRAMLAAAAPEAKP